MARYNQSENSSKAAGGVGFCGLLAIAFIVLKLCGVIDWGWGWVLSPIWIPLSLVGLICFIVLTVVLVKKALNDEKK